MKKIISIAIFLPLLFAGVVFAQDDNLPDPGMTPDSPLYFLKTWKEKIQTLFTFGKENKAKQYLHLAEVRLAEYEKMIEMEKTEIAQKTFEKYERQLNHALEKAGEAKEKGKSVADFEEEIGQKILKHQEVLERVLEKVPEQAKPAIEKAIEASTKEHKEGLEELKLKKVSSDIDYELIKAKCLESGAPTDMCDAVEKALQSDFSPRELCENSGMPSEMCQQIPNRGFKSFEEIEALCAESGGPTEACSSLESKCKEMGITKPDDCFRVLSISSVTVYQAAELKTVPRPTVGPEVGPAPYEKELDCPRGQITYGTTKYCCEDSDASSPYKEHHIYMKGTTESKVINTVDGTLTSHEINVDSCNGDKLTEWLCGNRNESLSEEHDCVNGCKEGRCVRGEEWYDDEPEESAGGVPGGIGIEFTIKNGQLTIVGLLENSPAEKAGLQVGDKILAIGGTVTTDLTISEATQLIGGEVGTNVVLLISGDSGEAEGLETISIIRTQITP